MGLFYSATLVKISQPGGKHLFLKSLSTHPRFSNLWKQWSCWMPNMGRWKIIYRWYARNVVRYQWKSNVSVFPFCFQWGKTRQYDITFSCGTSLVSIDYTIMSLKGAPQFVGESPTKDYHFQWPLQLLAKIYPGFKFKVNNLISSKSLEGLLVV